MKRILIPILVIVMALWGYQALMAARPMRFTDDYLPLAGGTLTGDVYFIGGDVGIGNAVPDGPLHVQSATAGAVAASANGDEIVAEGGGNTGISILSPDVNNSALIFASPGNDFGAYLQWTFTAGRDFVLATNHAGGNLKLKTGAAADALSLDANQNVSAANSDITVGSGTGVTVNTPGHINRQVYKVTTVFGAYTDSDTTKGIVIATLPAKMKIVGFYADTTAAYTGGATNAATMVVGITAESAAEIIASHNVFAAPILAGDADAEMGTAMTRAAAIQGGYLPSWSGTTAIYATLVIVNDILSNLTAGSTTFYIETEQY